MLIWMLAVQLGAGTVLPTPPVTLPRGCRVVDAKPADAPPGGAGRLWGICGKRGVIIGPARRYSAATNPVTGAVAVTLVRTNQTEVLLISPMAGGDGVNVDNVTRELTKLTGRAPDLGLGPATPDTSRFALDGMIGVTGAGATRSLDLGIYTARAARLVPKALPTTVSSTATATTTPTTKN